MKPLQSMAPHFSGLNILNATTHSQTFKLTQVAPAGATKRMHTEGFTVGVEVSGGHLQKYHQLIVPFLKRGNKPVALNITSSADGFDVISRAQNAKKQSFHRDDILCDDKTRARAQLVQTLLQELVDSLKPNALDQSIRDVALPIFPHDFITKALPKSLAEARKTVEGLNLRLNRLLKSKRSQPASN